VERSGEVYEQLLARLRETLSAVAEQVEDEVRRGRPVAVKTLSPVEKLDRSARVREVSGPGSRISGEDLATIEYTDDEKLRILVDALRRLGSSMAASREALARLVTRHQITGAVRFRSEGTLEPEALMDFAREAREARGRFDQVADSLRRALQELR
jgi:hypothetical protein